MSHCPSAIFATTGKYLVPPPPLRSRSGSTSWGSSVSTSGNTSTSCAHTPSRSTGSVATRSRRWVINSGASSRQEAEVSMTTSKASARSVRLAGRMISAERRDRRDQDRSPPVREDNHSARICLQCNRSPCTVWAMNDAPRAWSPARLIARADCTAASTACRACCSSSSVSSLTASPVIGPSSPC